jgi:hypothetical protein
VTLVLVLLVTGLAGLLYLSTSVDQGAFALSSLQARETLYADRVQELTGQVQADEAPALLAQRAEALGMVPDPDPAFISAASGLVSGDTPLAGRYVHLRHLPADGIWIGPGGPPAPVATFAPVRTVRPAVKAVKAVKARRRHRAGG